MYYTPIPSMTDTFRDPPVKKLREQKGDTALLFFSGTLMNFWSGIGLIVEDDVSIEDIAQYDALRHGFDVDMAKEVMRMMLEKGYLKSRPYNEEFDGVPQYQERLDHDDQGNVKIISEEAVNGKFTSSCA